MSDAHDADSLSSQPSGSEDSKKSACDEFAVTVLRYLDNDLEGQELEDFCSHLNSCENCQAHLGEEVALSKLLHRSRPLYSAPVQLRARISAATEHPSLSTSPRGRSYELPPEALSGGLWNICRRFPSLRVLAPAALAIVLCLAFVPDMVRNVRAASYVDTAAAEHRCYLDGSLPITFHSSSPELVTTWLTGKVPFDFHLPRAESTPQSKPVYRLIGASVVDYKGSPAALVMYETQNEKITLFAVSSKATVIAGGDEVRYGSLIFHYHTDSGFRVITWNNHGLSYALVSSVSAPAHESCMVCHQNMTDKGAFTTRR
jgi:mycothiol system anti-sigma-R factor